MRNYPTNRSKAKNLNRYAWDFCSTKKCWDSSTVRIGGRCYYCGKRHSSKKLKGFDSSTQE